MALPTYSSGTRVVLAAKALALGFEDFQQAWEPSTLGTVLLSKSPALREAQPEIRLLVRWDPQDQLFILRPSLLEKFPDKQIVNEVPYSHLIKAASQPLTALIQTRPKPAGSPVFAVKWLGDPNVHPGIFLDNDPHIKPPQFRLRTTEEGGSLALTWGCWIIGSGPTARIIQSSVFREDWQFCVSHADLNGG